MAKIAFRQSTALGRKVSLDLATQDEPAQNDSLLSSSRHLRSVLSLYDVCITQLTKLRACLMDGRVDDALVFSKNCTDILTALDDDLDRSVELAENFHVLYQHCLRHLGADGRPLAIENVDAVKMVVQRLRRLYVHLDCRETDRA
ncbi:MAG: flagellar protein FliS [Desulfovibrionaceae bacterium]|nr:flagellar protein FliS [Desulfovibrionaceae bacterium]